MGRDEKWELCYGLWFLTTENRRLSSFTRDLRDLMELFGIFVPVVDVRGKSPAEARL